MKTMLQSGMRLETAEGGAQDCKGCYGRIEWDGRGAVHEKSGVWACETCAGSTDQEVVGNIKRAIQWEMLRRNPAAARRMSAYLDGNERALGAGPEEG